ncbi:NUDIX domain-containing protein [Kitasatospora sp. NPDC017646]|uniref:NUDIX domain-containing protein n=1 Tax=Kitasatospora sp. NPDC017646 TaxID=3364024 RepID=UPI0037B4B74D
MPKWIPPAEYLKTMPQALHGCAVFVTDQRNRVLLLHEAPNEQRDAFGAEPRWLFPGGRLDHGENPLRAAARETLEETGLDLTGILRPLATDFRDPTKHRPAVTDYHFDGGWLTAAQAGAIRLSDEHDSYAFRSLTDWQPILPPNRYDLLSSLTQARTESRQLVLHNGRPM